MKLRVYISCLILCVFLFVAAPADAQDVTPHFGLEVGTSFGTAGSGTSMFSHRLAPSLSWDISKDFQLVAGTIFSSTSLNGFRPLHGSSFDGQNRFDNHAMQFQSTTVYAFGVYHLNPRISISGGTWFERSNFDMPESFLNPYQQNPQGMMLGLDYRVNENLRFGFEVNASRGVSPFYPTSFQHSPFHPNHQPHRPFRNHGW